VNYTETIDYLFAKLPVFERVGAAALKSGLSNITALCDGLGNPQHKFKSIHVAGTNGKGSTSHLLAAVFQSSGYKTGLHTSPHLKLYTERFKIDGQLMPEQYVVDFVQANQYLIDRIKPSFFEISVAMAFEYFASQQVDIAIIEVGLGGRLDSTNIITPILSVITNIGYDHTDLLGNTLPEIANEKAGIIKPNVPVVISEQQPEILQLFIDKAATNNSKITFADSNFRVEPVAIEQGRRVVDVYFENQLKYHNIKLDLIGIYQLKNIGGVLQSLEVLKSQGFKLHSSSIIYALEYCTTLTNFKGRWTQLQLNPVVIADVAHNFDGLKVTLNQIESYTFDKLVFVLGFVKDKDLQKILPLFPTTAVFYFCEAKTPRALPASDLADIAKTYNIIGSIVPDVNEALEQAILNSNPNDFIYVGGSTFVVSELTDI
jgi:dihydrofolate synthase / folylpolyglutamate synthase